MTNFEFYLTSSLEKVFADERPKTMTERSLTTLKGDQLSLQLVYKQTDGTTLTPNHYFKVEVDGAPDGYELRTVELMPSNLPCIELSDTNYLRKTPGLYPDLLMPFDGTIKVLPNQYRSVWITLPFHNVEAGHYQVTIKATALGGYTSTSSELVASSCALKQSYSEVLSIEVIDAVIPPFDFIHTEWFHGDCLANYYKTEIFSEQHWHYLENFIAYAGEKCGINMILTPIFTPPLDTKVDGERTTIQLVDIQKNDNLYTFNFDKLGRWCDLITKYGITYIEIAHFFTQWGAYKTPKIIATVNGKPQKIFGWHVSAQDDSYKEFLECFIPELLSCLNEKGFTKKNIYFHISDEPEDKDLENYLASKALVSELLKGYYIMDALSSVDLYNKGAVDLPVTASDHIEPFMTLPLPERWVYYCIAQASLVPNRFFAMPSARNRIMGILMYIYEIKGFLHWGYNFYNSQYSTAPINPFMVTDCNMSFNSGDAFLVYPGEDGTVLGSIRNEVQMDGFRDYSVLKLLESLKGRAFVLELLHEDLSYKITFQKYPITSEYLLTLRSRANHAISLNLFCNL